MPVISLGYRFQQPFRQPARDAFRWCTDFGPVDGKFFSPPVRRSVKWTNEDTLVMTDTKRVDGTTTRIQRLVRIYPPDLAWTNTHLTGPYRGSQFWYRVVPDGARRSYLDFIGLALRTVPRSVPPSLAKKMAEVLRKEDSTMWRTRLAPALEQDLEGE